MTRHEQNDGSGEKSSDELRAELDQTRERVSEDVEALGNKLSPENLKAEAKQAVARTIDQGTQVAREKWHEGTERLRDTVRRGSEQVRETVGTAEHSIVSFVRANPVPLALIGAGVGLLLLSSRRKPSNHPDPAIVGRGGVYEDFDDETLGARSVGTLGHLRERARSGLTSAEHAASDAARKARARVEDLEQRAKHGAHRAQAAAERSFEEQPLVLGAVALGTGIAIGLSIPATESENQLVGRYRDKVFGSFKERVKELEGKAEGALATAAESLTQGGNAGAQQPSAAE